MKLKYLMLLFAGCGYGAGKAITIQVVRDGEYLPGCVSLAIAVAFMVVSYVVIIRHLRRAHAEDRFVVEGLKTRVWLFMPIGACLVGLLLSLADLR
jgi:hypothetical protein